MLAASLIPRSGRILRPLAVHCPLPWRKRPHELKSSKSSHWRRRFIQNCWCASQCRSLFLFQNLYMQMNHSSTRRSGHHNTDDSAALKWMNVMDISRVFHWCCFCETLVSLRIWKHLTLASFLTCRFGYVSVSIYCCSSRLGYIQVSLASTQWLMTSLSSLLW